jgi:uncharacterized protein YegJ (DUF2314 family)
MKLGHIAAAAAVLVTGGIALAWTLDSRSVEARSVEPERTVVETPSEDEALIRARALARASFGDFWARVTKDRTGMDAVSVKVSIPYGRGVEHLWMTGCKTHTSEMFECAVSNEPEHVKLRLGVRYRFHADAISDWMYRQDGKIHGGYSIRALLPTMPTDQAEVMRTMLAPLPK